jgi:hypothetical protein
MLNPYSSSYTADHNWPNTQTEITSLSLFGNLFCKITETSFRRTAVINAPVRILSISRAINDKEYSKVLFDVSAFAALFFPHGALLSMGLDGASEVLSSYKNSKNSNEVDHNWPNTQAKITYLSLFGNFFCKVAEIPLEKTIVANIPIRILSISRAVNDKEYSKVLFDVSAFATLFFPHGALLSMGLDGASEVLNFYKNSQSTHSPNDFNFDTSKRLDPSLVKDAYEILSIPKEKEKDPKFIEGKYNQIVNALRAKLRKASGTAADGLKKMIADREQAYETLNISF